MNRIASSLLGLTAALAVVTGTHSPANAADYRSVAAAHGGTLTSVVFRSLDHE